MSGNWKIALTGALGGAFVSLVIVFGAAALGWFPEEQNVRETLLRNPEIVQQAADAYASQQQQVEAETIQAAVDKLGPKAYLDPKIAFVSGPADAKNTIVEFFDYNCPFCRASLPAMKKYYDTHKDSTRFAFVEFPIKGDESVLATRALLAARRQPGKYIPFHFALMSQDALVDANVVDSVAKSLGLDLVKLHADMDDPAIAHTIAAAELLSKRSKITGTPSFIVNGNFHEGAIDDDLLADLLKRPKRA